MSVDTRALTESRSLLSGAMLAAWTLLFPGLGFAQLVDSRAPAPGVHVAERPDATLVAVAVVIPVGSAQDPQGAPGTARFLAEAIAHSVRQRVDAYPSWVDVRVTPLALPATAAQALPANPPSPCELRRGKRNPPPAAPKQRQTSGLRANWLCRAGADAPSPAREPKQ